MQKKKIKKTEKQLNVMQCTEIVKHSALKTLNILDCLNINVALFSIVIRYVYNLFLFPVYQTITTSGEATKGQNSQNHPIQCILKKDTQ